MNLCLLTYFRSKIRQIATRALIPFITAFIAVTNWTPVLQHHKEIAIESGVRRGMAAQQERKKAHEKPPPQTLIGLMKKQEKKDSARLKHPVTTVVVVQGKPKLFHSKSRRRSVSAIEAKVTDSSSHAPASDEEEIANEKPGMNSRCWGPPLWLFLELLPRIERNFILSLQYILPCKMCRSGFRGFVREHSIDSVRNPLQLARYINRLHNSVNARHNADPKEGHYVKPLYSFREHLELMSHVPTSEWAKALTTALYFILQHYPDTNLDNVKTKRLRQEYKRFVKELTEILPDRHPFTRALHVGFVENAKVWEHSDFLIQRLFEIEKPKDATIEDRTAMCERSMNPSDWKAYVERTKP